MVSGLTLVCLLVVLASVRAQDYAEYAREAGARKRNNRGVVVTSVLSAVFGGVVGNWMSSRKLKKKHDKEKKDLLQYMQLQEEIYKQREAQWQKEYGKLYTAYSDLEKETVERDYEEFKAPDANNDDMISHAEFNTYVRKYLASFPELSEKDFPKFEEFDLDHDGQVSFDEWQQFLYQQKLMEAKKKQEKGNKEKGNSAYTDLLNALYEQSNQADNFNALQKNAQKGGGRRV